MDFSFVITGPIPSKKNSKRVYRLKNGRTLVLSSEEYIEWEKEHIAWIRAIGTPNFGNREWLSIECEFKSKTKRKFDLSNRFESVADMLVKAGVIKDDNYSVLSSVKLIFSWYGCDECAVTIKDS